METNDSKLILSKEGAHYKVIIEPDETDDFLILVKRIHSNGGMLINERMIIRPDLQQHIDFYTDRGFSLQTVSK